MYGIDFNYSDIEYMNWFITKITPKETPCSLNVHVTSRYILTEYLVRQNTNGTILCTETFKPITPYYK